jgi:hypothetical protein
MAVRNLVLDECPLCDHELRDGRADRLAGHVRETHSPADAGLPPLPEDLRARPDFTTAEDMAC